jgi:AraC family ethanolamine operon transcriptional activator
MTYYQELRLQKFDPDALLHILNNTEMEHRLLAGGETEACWQRIVLGDLTISVGDYRFPACITGRIPHGQVFIGLYNHLADAVRENYRLVSPDSLLLYAPGLERHCTSLGFMGWNMLMLPVRRLQETATALYGVELEWPSQGIRHLDLHPVLAERLRQQLRGLLRLGKHLASLPDEELTDSLASEELIQLLVQAIVNGARPAGRVAMLTAGQRHALATMEACLRRWQANPGDELRASSITDTSQRMLEMATRNAYGVTPHNWIKVAKLNVVYRDLLSGNCTSVTSACQRWGIGHMGRLAAEYRELFGESPRETLKRLTSPGTPAGRRSYSVPRNFNRIRCATTGHGRRA